MQTILQLNRVDHNKVAILSTLAQSVLDTSEGIKNLDALIQECGYANNKIIRVKRASLGFINNDIQLIVDFEFDDEFIGANSDASFYVKVKEGNKVTGGF